MGANGVFSSENTEANGVFSSENTEANGVFSSENTEANGVFSSENTEANGVFSSENTEANGVFSSENTEANGVFSSENTEANGVFSSENTIAYIGIGSNLDDPLSQVQQAFVDLDAIIQSHCAARSPLYRTAPVGPAGQPDYINAVAALTTALDTDDLLLALQAIEQQHGRQRRIRWGPRTLDLDILVYGTLQRADPCLTIPHPHLHERAFVLYPLVDIAPDLVIPGLGQIQQLLHNCPPLAMEKLAL